MEVDYCRYLSSLERAWVLVRADEPMVAQQIYGLNDGLPWPELRVVRADLVEGPDGMYIVVPIWAVDEAGLDRILQEIGRVSGDPEPQMYRVARDGGSLLHTPFPPHEAEGYIPEVERSSPVGPLGLNGWG